MSICKHTKVCSVENTGSLDNSIRRFLHNPRKILSTFVSDGMTILDLGCGPGVFTLEMAKMLNVSRKVIAADLQEGMLDIIRRKIKGTDLEQRIELHKCRENSINVTENVDFVLAFYVIHEMPDLDELFKELKLILKPGGKILIVEPLIHVSKKAFEKMIDKLKFSGFEIIDKPKVFFSRSVVITKAG
ncbi:MAG: class I SAM-dependent methyltransferase [Ignavibacteriae bacterium]|nr:MAG: class I SAM-dependent methyltransferase [Ignavibacteriota bacterium]